MNHKLESSIGRIEQDIKSVKVQGATNVAFAVVEGMRLVLVNGFTDVKELRDELLKTGERLSNARENEPLARNAVKYIISKFDSSKDDPKGNTKRACEEYINLIASSKQKIIEAGIGALSDSKVILNHCHSSTAVAILKELKAEVIATETRPLFQGRITAVELLKESQNVSLIVDDAAASFILDKGKIPVDTVLVGCDELLEDGSFINKIGSLQLALAAKEASDKYFVAVSLLKLDPLRNCENIKIEERGREEVWAEAPAKLKIINPAFDIVDAKFVSGYITEGGVLKREELVEKAKNLYPWIF